MASILQSATVFIALLSTMVALYYGHQSASSANAASELTAQEADESQLPSLLTSLNQGALSVRETRVLLMVREIQGIVSLSLPTSVARQGAYDDYASALAALGVYISHAPKETRNAVIEFGTTPNPIVESGLYNTTSAVIELAALKTQVEADADNVRPVINLAGDQFWGVNWTGINLGWLTADMKYVNLQCADLSGANLRGVDFYGADLRGAIVQGADFRGASLDGTELAGVSGHARGSFVTNGTMTARGGDAA